MTPRIRKVLYLMEYHAEYDGYKIQQKLYTIDKDAVEWHLESSSSRKSYRNSRKIGPIHSSIHMYTHEYGIHEYILIWVFMNINSQKLYSPPNSSFVFKLRKVLSLGFMYSY